MEPLGRFLLHVRRRATVITADSTTWNRRILTLFSGLPGVGRATSWVSRLVATLERGRRSEYVIRGEFHGFLSSTGSAGILAEAASARPWDITHSGNDTVIKRVTKIVVVASQN
jgi:hypothetical protein